MKFLSALALLMLTACGGGSIDDQPDVRTLGTGSSGVYAWDGSVPSGVNPHSGSTYTWVCRDTGTNRSVDLQLCANLPINDQTWSTVGVPLTTDLWYRGADIEAVCAERLAGFTGNRGHTKIYQETIEVPGMTADQSPRLVGWHWRQPNGVWSVKINIDKDNWAVFVIAAAATQDFGPAQCRAFVTEAGVYRGYI